MNPAVLEAALSEFCPDDLDHLAFLLRERAARIRAEPPKPRQPESIFVPASSIWSWVLTDMVKSGHDRRFAAEIVADLARAVDHLEEAEIEALLIAGLREAVSS